MNCVKQRNVEHGFCLFRYRKYLFCSHNAELWVIESELSEKRRKLQLTNGGIVVL